MNKVIIALAALMIGGSISAASANSGSIGSLGSPVLQGTEDDVDPEHDENERKRTEYSFNQVHFVI